MGAAQTIDIRGAKGGSKKPKTPIEASDNLRSTNIAKLLIAVGEGEFEGVPTDADIYLDNTPIKDASGNVNFPNVKWEWRSGSVDQTYIPGIPSVENETSLNIELRSDAAWVRSVTNIQLSAVRIRFAWPALQRQDDQGNVGGYRIEYAIDVATDGGAYQQVLSEAVDGKTTTRYERSRRIDLPEATIGWQIRVRRITPNQNSNRIADTMLIAGFTEVIDAKLRYPNTALLYIEFDAEQFTNIPAVTVKCKARKWQVPSNYDPISRTYTGTWDGSMKLAWTNNPAWITYGICTEDRFGLGKRIKSFMVDKWELYRIAQYCDQLVPDGLGGTEPRFLCDMNLQGKADAWTLLRDISGIYRGMTYWAQGQLIMQADMPRAQDFDYVFTRANVIDGKFSYGSASAKTRYTRALVSYDNPANNYDTDVIPFSDLPLQRRYGDRPTELSAIGCTRASEAQRRGKWAILSNNLDRTVTFKTGMEGVIPLPGHIIPVADSLLAGREIGGRISAAAGRVVTLDRDTQAKAGDRLIINLPGGRAEGRTVQSVAGRAVTVTVAYSEAPRAQLQWALDADDLAIPLYRVLRTKRTTEGDFEISALQYEPSKFAHIDTGARLEDRPISAIPITVVPAPASVTAASTSSVVQGLAVATMTISWPAVEGAVAYDVEWRKDSGNWIKVQRTGSTNVDVVGIYAGAYVARVRAVSAFDISSIWRSSALTELSGKEGLPPAVSFLTATPLLFGIGLKWGFPAGAEDTQRTEIWYGPANELEAATKLADLAYPQSDYSMQSLLAGASFFFWARLVDRIGNIGPWYPVGGGVLGQASSEAGPILDLIAGQIGETELSEELRGEIEKIPGLQAQIDALEGLAAYNPDETYVEGDLVVFGKRIYQAIGPVPVDTPPPNLAYWLDVGQTIETVDGLAQQVAINTVNITELEATATSFEALRASWRDDDGEGDLADAIKGWTSTTAIASESGVRASENEAIARRVTTFDAQIGENAANLTTLEQVVATNESATATKIDQLNAAVGNNTAAIQQTATAYADTSGKLSTMWSVKMQLNANGQYVATGIGLGIENVGGTLQSQFLVSADRFAIVNTIAGGAISVPFAVQGGQVFMNSAFIQDGSITMLKIGQALQSDNYVAGVQGWRLDKAGNLEFNGPAPGGGRLTMTNRAIKVYDENGIKRVQLGDLSA
ncbi:host specificity protein J [Pseudomonas sp. 7SR1]|uniref:host specificity protein J n=1 Tax=Pseudomonas sp. 7SR1 TaxID=1881017 RepID=UPI00095386B4|nr:phage tail protein [Pseudomonas sp. 7SR1]ROO33616.1 host specificity protein [Pseudomonas sp. 7SR1]SIS23450.1 Phage-related protein, tail component [Pseudomonas sp. 7SR1]